MRGKMGNEGKTIQEGKNEGKCEGKQVGETRWRKRGNRKSERKWTAATEKKGRKRKGK